MNTFSRQAACTWTVLSVNVEGVARIALAQIAAVGVDADVFTLMISFTLVNVWTELDKSMNRPRNALILISFIKHEFPKQIDNHIDRRGAMFSLDNRGEPGGGHGNALFTNNGCP